MTDVEWGALTPAQREWIDYGCTFDMPLWMLKMAEQHTEKGNTMNTPGYESLANVLERAYGQAAHGKGAERHACQRPFTEQPMQTISELLQSPVGLLYQAMKKIQESQRLDKDAGVRELLGAINYIAGAVVFLEAEREPAPPGAISAQRRSAVAQTT